MIPGLATENTCISVATKVGSGWACDWNEANEISFYDFWRSPWKRGCLFLPELLSCWNVSLDMLWSSLLPLGKSRAENRASKRATVCCHGGGDSFFLTFFKNLERFLFSSVLINCVSWASFTCPPVRLVDKYDIRIGIGFLALVHSLLGCFCHSHLFSLPCLWICGLVRGNVITCGRMW